MSISAKNNQKSVKQSLGDAWDENHRNNSVYNVGAEIEDLLFDVDGEPINNRSTEAILRSLVKNEGAEPKTQTIGGEEKLLGTKIHDELFQVNEDFKAEIDTDYHPAQGEVATEVFQNPADMTFRTEHLRYLRDRNMPEGVSSHELGMFVDDMLPGREPDPLSRPKKRYNGLRKNHGDEFDSMGWIGATQLNTGSPVDGQNLEIDQFFQEFFNGGDLPSMLDVVPAVDSLFTNDPILEENSEGEYEIAVEGGRDFRYDEFVSVSPAVLRTATERWEDVPGGPLPANENYGNIEDLSGIEDHEDYIDMAMERPMILSPEIDASDVEVLDPDTHEVVGTFEKEYDEDSTWVMPGFSDIGESTVSFKQFLEDKKYLGEVLVEENGEEELRPVKVDHSSLEDGEFNELAALGGEDEAGYFTFHNTFVRPDIAPKNNGVIEFRSFSNSGRSYEALLTQKSLMHSYREVQELFDQHGLSTENALDFREDAKREGLDAHLPSGATVREVYQDELVDVLSEGVRESFSDTDMPYTLEMVLEGVDDYDDFGDYLDAEFDDLKGFAEFTASGYEAGIQPERGSYEMDEFEEEYEQFLEWFTDTYRDTMLEYLDEEFEGEDEFDTRNFGTESEKVKALLNAEDPDAVREQTMRNNYVEAR